MKYQWPIDQDEPENWRDLFASLGGRYQSAEGTIYGINVWQLLILRLISQFSNYMKSEYRPNIDESLDEDALSEFPGLFGQLNEIRTIHSRFLADIRRDVAHRSRHLLPPLATKCLFISHRQSDAGFARRVACIAQEHGYECWLDIEDPNLVAINRVGGLIPSTVRAVLIAAIIEIGLLNSTHVIALLSNNAIGSQWVPYEYGRAKAFPAHECTPLWTPTAATWIQDALRLPEYALLANVVRTERQLRVWLGGQRRPHGCEGMTRKHSLDH